MNIHSAANQKIKSRLVEKYVLKSVSVLISELSKRAEMFPEYQEELSEAYIGNPNYEECATDNYGEYDSKSGKYCIGDIETYADSWKELCEEGGFDTSNYHREVMEHWLVDESFGSLLKRHDEKVIKVFNLVIWCRCCCGSAIHTDEVITKVADSMQILEFQDNDWSEQ